MDVVNGVVPAIVGGSIGRRVVPNGQSDVKPMRIALGVPVSCAGDTVGVVADVLVDPEGRRLTHVAVRTGDKNVRLVPAELVTRPPGERGLALACTSEQLFALEPIGHFAYLHFTERPTPEADAAIGVEDMFAIPYYQTSTLGDYSGDFEAGIVLRYDEIPKGKAELRRSSAVHSADGYKLGHVDGIILRDLQVTHLVLERGHLLGARHVAIPIEGIASIETDKVNVSLSRNEVRALPSARARRSRSARSPRSATRTRGRSSNARVRG